MLTESVNWVDVASGFSRLPEITQATADSPSGRDPLGGEEKRIQLATALYSPPALIWDYLIVSSSGNYTFNTYDAQLKNTYYISSPVYFTSATFVGGCVIKYADGAYLMVYQQANGPYNTPENPAILTSAYEDVYGDQIADGSTEYSGIPGYSAYAALWIYYPSSNVSLNGFKIRWAQTGILADGQGVTYNLLNSSLEWCQTGIYANTYFQIAGSNVRQCRLITPTSSPCEECNFFTGTMTDACPGNTDSDSNSLEVDPILWTGKRRN